MHPLVPQFILQADRAGMRRGSFPAVGLFVDLSGFTPLTEALMVHGQDGAEELAKVIRAIFAPLMQSVFEQGGFVSSQEGDAFTALFPAEAGDDCESCWLLALSAAIQIQQAAASHSRQPTLYGEFSIQVKIGLASGEAAWAILPSQDGRRAAYYFRGSAVDGCAAAEQTAQPGEILLEQEFESQIQGEKRTEGVGAFFRLLHFGGKLAAGRPVETPAIELELASRFFPRQLFTWSASGEFRQVAALFVSLPTIRTETQLEIFMQTLYRLQDRYGGVLDQLGFGDKGPHLLLFWGAPTAHENDVERLLNFILELQTQTAIPINGGVTYRMAHTGFVGSDLAESFSPFGSGTNLAARFMTAAPRGEIWLDETAAQRARGRFVLEDGGLHHFKGFAQAQHVYVLLERLEQAERPEKGTILGRAEELARLEEFAAPILAGGQAGVLVMRGEAGIGKSSLVQALRRQLAAAVTRPFQFVLGQCDEILRQPLNPFRYWLKQAFQISEGQAEARNKRNFNRKVEELIGGTSETRLADELDRTRSFLGALIDLHWPDSLYEQLDAKGRYENTFLALTAFLKAESLRQPILFLLEDAHWLDDDSRAYLPRLLRALNVGSGEVYPVAFLITSRPEGVELDWGGFPIQEMALDRLDRPALSAQAASILGGPASTGLVDLVEERTEGNPFFSEQILQYLQGENQLLQTPDGWNVKKSRSLSVPAEVGSLLVARLDRLEPELKEAVQTASVLGREFDLSLLKAMLPVQADFTSLLVLGEEEKIWNRLSEGRGSFQHALLREAAYQMQNQSRRQFLHRQALDACLAAYAANPKDHYGELAYHAEHAGRRALALEFFELAGRASQETYLNRQAEEYLTRALELVTPDQPQKRFELLLMRESVLDIQGKIETRLQDLEELEQISAVLGEAGKILEVNLHRASYLLDTGSYPEAALHARMAIEMALAQGDVEKEVSGYKCLAISHLRQAQYPAANVHAQKGLELAQRIGFRHEEGLLWNLLGLIAVEQRSLDQARASFERSLDLARSSSRPSDQAPALTNLGMVSGLEGDFSAARTYYEQTLEIARKIGDRQKEGLMLGNLGWILGSIGDYEKARFYNQQFLHISREVGDRNGEIYSLINLSSYAAIFADQASAETCAREALDLARKGGDRSAEAWALTYLGHCCLQTGRIEEAAVAYHFALQMRVELEQPVLALEPRAGLARAHLEQKENAAALDQVEPILAHLSQGSLEGAEEPVRIFLSCLAVLQAVGDPRASEIRELGRSYLLARADAIQDEETRRMFLENNPFHRALLSKE